MYTEEVLSGLAKRLVRSSSFSAGERGHCGVVCAPRLLGKFC